MSLNGDEGTPVLSQTPSLRVPFLELRTVASSSFVSSPTLEFISTPQVQLRRLREELAHEGGVRNELEARLSECISTISEKDSLISQLQHRVQRSLRDLEELENSHGSALQELQLKNDGLLNRVHEVVKQCQDLKVDNSQKDRRIVELMEDNGKLAAQVRNTFARLTRAAEEVSELKVAHKLSQEEWGSRRDSLQTELSQAVTDRECLGEQVQILQGKISVLEDELSKVSDQVRESGEVLGPVMERDGLKLELAGLALKLSQQEETVSCLRKEKMDTERMLSEERRSSERESLRYQGLVSDLQESMNSIRAEKEAQEQSARRRQEQLIARVAALERELTCLQQLEGQLTAEAAVSADLRQQRRELETKVASLEDTVNALHVKCQGMEVEREAQQEALDALRTNLQKAQASLDEYEGTLVDHQRVVEENSTLWARISDLDGKMASLAGESYRAKELLEKTVAEFSTKQNQDHQELETLKKEKKDLASESSSLRTECQNLQAEIKSQLKELNVLKADLQDTQDGYQKDLETLKNENEHLSTVNQALQAEHQSLQAEIKRLQVSQDGHLRDLDTLQNKKEQLSVVNASLQSRCQNLQAENKAQQEALGALKADELRTLTRHQREQEAFQKRKDHLSALNLSLQRERDALQASLKTAEREVKALRAKLKLASEELQKTRASEKNLLVRTQSLEVQLDYADCRLREQRKQEGQGAQVKPAEGVSLKVATEVPDTSTDSLDLDLEDSLNAASKPLVPGDASTPLVRISEGLVPRQGAQDGGSRDTVHSLHTTQPQCNRTSQKAHSDSKVVFEEPGPANSSDKRLCLPGYRGRNGHGSASSGGVAPSKLCMAAESEPDHVADDWMRIAELQSRNKACLPHLKSSYPLEARPSVSFSTHPVTDEDVCFGDPEETFRRASVVQSQLKDSFSSHRVSLAPPTANRDNTCTSQRISRTSNKAPEVHSVRSLLTRKRPAGRLQDQDTPEAKRTASCFLQPAASKSRSLCSAARNAENQPRSPAVRRRATAFVIENTPRSSGRVDSRLKRGVNKRKSPASTACPGRSNTAANFRSPLQPRRQVTEDPHLH